MTLSFNVKALKNFLDNKASFETFFEEDKVVFLDGSLSLYDFEEAHSLMDNLGKKFKKPNS